MAKNKIIRCLQAGVLSAVCAVATLSCTDDHFDVNNGGGIDENATKTLWEQIEGNTNLSRFAAILEKTPYFKDEAHPVAGYSFKDVLSGRQILTVFAPTNDAFGTDAEYQTLLAKCETDPYDVFLRVVGNHITRNRLVATGTGKAEDIVMLNGKRAVFDRQNKTFKDVALVEANIAATNGTLHTIGVQSSFSYNIYEYIKANGDTYGQLRKWLVEHDTIVFWPSLSAEGGSDKDGNPIYVDSFYVRDNTLFAGRYSGKSTDDWVMSHKGFGFGADLTQEDSVWAFILPTDAAWNAAYDKMKPMYTYAEHYTNMDNLDNSLGITSGEDEVGSADSLQNLSLRMDLASPLLFNVREQPRAEGQTSYWKTEDFISSKLPKMFNVRADTFYVADAKGELDKDGDVKAILTDGLTTPIAVSNGLIYPVDNWRFMTHGSKDVNVKVSYSSLFHHKEYKSSTIFSYQSFNNTTSKLVNDSVLGKVQENYFFYIRYGTNAPEVWFKLYDYKEGHQVLSNVKYDIQLVLVPTFYRLNPDSIVAEDEAYPIKRNKLRVQIVYNNGSLKGGKNNDVETARTRWVVDYDGTKVDTITVNAADDPFIFPYTYKNLSECYPLIHITSAATNSDVRKEYQHPFAIDRIILKARDE
ncbi:MAG: fasciclin domain-containing protein [Bacteroidaceae bacterium]|nr:fasciclin domain-containing protein [Bacteroidaceae bacterium]